jgi:isopenicillin-N N-acyltransferase like protein
MFQIIDLKPLSTGFKAGHLYGAQAAKKIAYCIHAYSQVFADCGIDWQQACTKAQEFAPIMQDLWPESVEQLNGIAAGSGQSLDSILALNCRSELIPAKFLAAPSSQAPQAHERNRVLGVGAAGYPDWNECTAMCVQPSASADQTSTWLAQNWDWMGGQRNALVILKGQTTLIQDSTTAIKYTTLSEAGMLAKIGLNQAGLALGLNIIRSIHDGEQTGIAVHWLLSYLLRCTDVHQVAEQIERLAQQVGFAASSNIMCADASGAVATFELSPKGVAQISPAPNGVVLHTNHFIDPKLANYQAQYARSLSTDARLERVGHLTTKPHFDLESLQTVLRDEHEGVHAICRRPDMSLPAASRIESVAGVIINTNQKRFWVAPNIPSKVAFQEIGGLWD